MKTKAQSPQAKDKQRTFTCLQIRQSKSPTQPAKRQQLTLDCFRKECIRDIRGSNFPGF